MNKNELLDRVRNIKLPDKEYAVFGGAFMCILGLREAKDIDIIVRNNIFEALKKDPNWKVSNSLSGSESLKMGDLEIFRDWKPGIWDIDELIKNAEIIESIPFVRIEDIIRWKKMMNRKKDIDDLELINNYLNSNKG